MRLRDSVEWLIDNRRAYDAIIDAMRDAQDSICISQLAFDADCVAYAPDGRAIRLLDALIAAHRDRGVRVRILLNESLLLDTAAPLRRALAAEGAPDIEVRGVSRFPQLLHAKIIVIDEQLGFLVGSPFANGYWDDETHRPTDHRRPNRELGGRPVHDLSVRITGPSVRQLADTFDEWWTQSGSQASPARIAPEPRHGAPPAGIRVVTTVPRNVLAACPAGRTDVLCALIAAIDRARDFIYLEHQYLSARVVVDALTRALDREPQLEVVAVLNQNPDVTAYRVWQNTRLRESGLLTHPRVGLFALWTREALDNDRWAVSQVFVHSKVLIIDGAWASVGSANLDGVSLHSYGADFTSALGEWVFRDVRNLDANVIVDGATTATARAVQRLQRALWQEHLGDDLDVASPPRGGWLSLWRARADAGVRTTNGTPHPSASGSFVLPYSTASRPARQLEALGVEPSALDIRFNPSWLEVHCSPNWIRNMFA